LFSQAHFHLINALSPPPIEYKWWSEALQASLVTNSECATYDFGFVHSAFGNRCKLTNLHSSPVAITVPPLDLWTPWICAPLTPPGYIPYTGHPNLTVQVAHISSLNCVAPSVIWFPDAASENNNSYEAETLWMFNESFDQSNPVMKAVCLSKTETCWYELAS